ncbi:hypothetical protein ElyMa_002497500 [Elysia marginata]|uniref:Uncharacterized protein n=1 Tax=Elysia marginata TaxID=1093978 RepID=A0AAV4GQ03_9GAST|nr:hypothetical protein ElyMa_002497500 [Elysia marginata]
MTFTSFQYTFTKQKKVRTDTFGIGITDGATQEQSIRNKEIMTYIDGVRRRALKGSYRLGLSHQCKRKLRLCTDAWRSAAQKPICLMLSAASDYLECLTSSMCPNIYGRTQVNFEKLARAKKIFCGEA